MHASTFLLPTHSSLPKKHKKTVKIMKGKQVVKLTAVPDGLILNSVE